MSLILSEKDIAKIIMVGDRVLVKPKSPMQKTTSGLYLPPSVEKKEKLQSGYVLKVGPGYPIASTNDFDEPWKDTSDEIKYIPIQPQIGDLAVYLQSSAFEINFNDQKFLVIPNSAILMLIRDDELIG